MFARPQSRIAAAGCRIGDVTPGGDDPNNAGRITEQGTPQGTAVPAGTDVDLKIAGPVCTVPSLVGMTEADARAAVGAQGCTLRTDQRATTNPADVGKVTTQNPTPPGCGTRPKSRPQRESMGMPAGLPIFDAHFHVIDDRFPLQANQGFVPEPYPVAAYRAAAAPLGVVGGAVVAGSFQAFDRGWLLAALEELGSGYVGVAQLPASVTEEEIASLDAAGVRAVRFNLYRGGSATEAELNRLARRVWDVAGWHVELYVDAATIDVARLVRLPKIVIDHLGMTADGQDSLLHLVEAGALVKATGFGRVELDVAEVLRAVSKVNPGALLFGTDLPSTRARRPFEPADADLVVDTLGERNARLALHDNGVALYRPGKR